jgi:hypothetical protein
MTPAELDALIESEVDEIDHPHRRRGGIVPRARG